MFSQALLDQATTLLDACRARSFQITTAESCTGGLIAGLLTDIAGSSDVVDRGFVTYSNAAKIQMLGVPADLIRTHGAVSGSVAEAMVRGAKDRSKTDIAIAVTGIAGPGGGSADKPVGLVWFGLATADGSIITEQQIFSDSGRTAIRLDTVAHALALISRAIA